LLNRERLSRSFRIFHRGREGRVAMTADPFNSRIRLKSFSGDPAFAAASLLQTARKLGLGKALAFVRPSLAQAFPGFRPEGEIPGYFAGERAVCLAGYTVPNRGVSRDPRQAGDILDLAREGAGKNRREPTSYTLRPAVASDCRELALLYRRIFGESYPSPVYEADYLREAMAGHSRFWVVEHHRSLIGAASLEVDSANRSAELTDCAVLPEYRGYGLLGSLTEKLEDAGRGEGLISIYSLSRALQPGINIVLSAAGYRWHGRLINNCRICGSFEDMNIWQKFIVTKDFRPQTLNLGMK
jgi:beta-lysine N6-acetyltransferase